MADGRCLLFFDPFLLLAAAGRMKLTRTTTKKQSTKQTNNNLEKKRMYASLRGKRQQKQSKQTNRQKQHQHRQQQHLLTQRVANGIHCAVALFWRRQCANAHWRREKNQSSSHSFRRRIMQQNIQLRWSREKRTRFCVGGRLCGIPLCALPAVFGYGLAW